MRHLFFIVMFFFGYGLWATDIFDAIAKLNIEFVREYLSNGGNVEARKKGCTLLMWATDGPDDEESESDYLPIMNMLLDAGADVNAKYKDKTALDYTLKEGNLEIARELVKHKARAYSKKSFFIVAAFGVPDLVGAMLEMDADSLKDHLNEALQQTIEDSQNKKMNFVRGRDPADCARILILAGAKYKFEKAKDFAQLKKLIGEHPSTYIRKVIDEFLIFQARDALHVANPGIPNPNWKYISIDLIEKHLNK